MTERPILDAGPGLNFFATNSERLLIGTLGPLAMPETVRDEMTRKANSTAHGDQRFGPAARVLGKLGPKFLTTLSDEATAELASAVQRIARVPMASRMRSKKDLGEIMVLAHAAIAADAGAHVTVLIDDGGGQRLAAREQARLDRLRTGGREVGVLQVIDTVTVLRGAADRGLVADRGAMRRLYERMRDLDDGLMPIGRTDLLQLPCWRSPVR